MKKQNWFLGAVLLIFAACQSETDKKVLKAEVSAPKAKKEAKELTIHGHSRIDNYYWLRNRESEEVLDYLKNENEHTKSQLEHTEALQEKLFEEIKGRIKENDESVPYKLDDYYYYTRYEEGLEYPIYCRKKGSLEAEEEIMINANKLAEGHEFFSMRSVNVSPQQNLGAFAVDTVGRRIYTIRFKNLETGEILKDEIPAVTGNMAWANDNKSLFYTRQDQETLRSNKIYKHILGTDSSKDELIYEEKDETFGCYVYKTKSKEYLVIGSYSTLSTENRILKADNPKGKFKIIQPRERDLEYSINHFEDKFYILTNYKAKNFKLVECPVNKTTKENWKDVIAHRDKVLLENVEIFKNFLVVDERKEGLTQLRIINWKDKSEHYLDFGEPTYTAYISYNPDFNTQELRYGYSSMTTPNSTFDYNMVSREKELKKQTEVVGDFDPANYVSERLFATTSDGTKIPMSIVYRKGIKKDGANPTLIYGYGSYGNSIDAYFSSSRLSLLDRGFVFAIAHIRGGQEMGRHWYEDGKLLKKKNTFTDFITCSEHLIKEGYTNKDKLFAMGGSAGGLLMGAVVNMRPDLYRGVIAAVPFVDVITTMLDESIPLTTGEYDEWGNPNDKEYYDYILSYSPYDNVEAKDYPNMLVTTGLHDSQVQYWEPAKWVAKLRELKTDDNLLLLHTNMEAGHGGASGRFKRFKETAMEYAFILDLAGHKEEMDM
ncbi:S9 family peptidase [Xanthovirga aplysinae]|uniref:S9 family peptidase n=1 Tax=Xanthovirga aplysinae TaxID=2529853 RepID=UPI0012BC1F80|nr:S9 family peptidase [Xanthovirga aplysinae]